MRRRGGHSGHIYVELYLLLFFRVISILCPKSVKYMDRLQTHTTNHEALLKAEIDHVQLP